MRIAFVSYEYPPLILGGAGTYAYNITKEIAELGHEVLVFTPTIAGHDPPPNVKIVEVPVNLERRFGAVQYWLGLPKLLKKHENEGKFDIIHYNGITYWHLRKQTSASMVVTVHHLTTDAAIEGRSSLVGRIIHLSDEAGLLMPFFEKRAVRQSSRLIAVSKFTRSRLIEEYGVDTKKVGVVYNGISYGPSAQADVVGAEKLIGGRDDRKIILFVGRIDNKRKGLDILVRSLPAVLKSHDVAVVVVGLGEKHSMEKLATELGVRDRVIFTGFVDDPTLIGLYKICDAYVSPSLMEGFGLTILDAQRFAKKIVATRVGAVPEIISDDTILVNPGDVGDLAEGIVKALEPSLPREETNQQKMSIDERFSWKEAAKRTLEEYKRSSEHG